MAKRSFYDRFAWPILIAHWILIPIACISAIRAVRSNRNDVSDWLPKEYDETRELAWFRDHFVADQFVLISWDGANLGEAPDGSEDDPKIAKLVEELKKARMKDPKTGEMMPVFKENGITTGRTVLQQLMPPNGELGRIKATERLMGSLIGPDGKQTVIMANLTEVAAHNLRAAIGRPVKRFGLIKHEPSPFFKALTAAGITEDEVRLGGPPVDNNAIDEEGENSLVKLAGLAGLLGISLAYYSLRSVKMTIVVFACGVISAALSLAIVYWSGTSMDAILMSMPALIYVLAVSGAVHVTNYYRQAVLHHGFEGAVERAIRHAWKPAFLCSITTGIGLASLHTSQIVPIAKFGDFSAIGVFAMLIILFLFLPATLKIWQWVPPEMRNKKAAAAIAKGTAARDYAVDHQGEFWVRFGTWVDRHNMAVMIACFAVIGVLCAGLPKVETSIDLLKLFSSDARLLADYRWFEERLGRIVPVELVVRFPEATKAEAPEAANLAAGQLVARHSMYERMKFVELIEKSLQERLGPPPPPPPGDKPQAPRNPNLYADLIGATMSVSTFAPEFKGEGSSTAAARIRDATNEQLLASRDELEGSGFLRKDHDRPTDDLFRISVRVAAFSDVDQGEVVEHVRDAVEPVMLARAAAVRALRALSQQRGGQPSGANVIFWGTRDGENPPQDPAPFLETKGLKSGRLTTDVRKLDERQWEVVLNRLDDAEGVILGPEFTNADIDRLRKAKINILAVYNAVEKDVADHAARAKVDNLESPDLSVVYTGVIPVVYKAQRELLNSLIQSTAWSFGTITPLMMYVCGGIAAGLVVIVPNALPVLVVFGGMGWLGIRVDIGSMMAASIALGVAVDDTIHFLAWFKDDFKALGERRAAVLSAYRRSATATLQAALINGLGLSVFATSSFTPTQRFGWLMLVILIAGMVAELVMLPSMLFGPVGRVFDEKKRKPAPGSAGTPALSGATASAVAAELPVRNGEHASDRPHAVREPHASGYRRQA
jgi:predicted RND superfamily exporter protein